MDITPQEGSYEQYTTGERTDADDFDDPGQGAGTKDGICATLDGAVGWAGLCPNDRLDLDAEPGRRLHPVTAHRRQDGGCR